MKWTDEKVESLLLGYIERLGRMPKHSELTERGLSLAIQRSGGLRRWGEKLGASTFRVYYDDQQLAEEIRRVAEPLGRMPTYEELGSRLGSAVANRRQLREWAEMLGLITKDSETSRGQGWEDHEEQFFRRIGLEVERQTTKASFDMLVAGKRVDVKSANWSEVKRKSGVLKGTWSRGFIFAGIKKCRDCDFLDLVCHRDGVFDRRFIVPAEDARVVTITITERTLGGYGKYSKFEGAIRLLGTP